MKRVAESRNRLKSSIDSARARARTCVRDSKLRGWIREERKFRVKSRSESTPLFAKQESKGHRPHSVHNFPSLVRPFALRHFRSIAFAHACTDTRVCLHSYTHCSTYRGGKGEQFSGNMYAPYAGKYRSRKSCIGIARDFMEPPGRSEQSWSASSFANERTQR